MIGNSLKILVQLADKLQSIFIMKKNYFLLIAVLVVFASSCTITKRRYNSGYHIEWKHAAAKVEKNNHENELAKVETPTEETVAPVETPASEPSVVTSTPANTVVSNPVAETSKSIAEKSVSKKSTTRTSNVSTATFEAPVQSKTSTQGFVPVADNLDSTESKALSQVDMVLLVILALLIPPLAVYLHQGSWNEMCWISLLLTILFWVPGVVFAFLVILDII